MDGESRSTYRRSPASGLSPPVWAGADTPPPSSATNAASSTNPITRTPRMLRLLPRGGLPRRAARVRFSFSARAREDAERIALAVTEPGAPGWGFPARGMARVRRRARRVPRDLPALAALRVAGPVDPQVGVDHNAAALRCDSTAPGPQANTAASR